MRRTWRNLFYFSKADRRAVLLLAGVLMGIVLSTSFFLWFDRRTPAKEDSGDSLVYERFFAGLKPDTVVVVRSGPTYDNLLRRNRLHSFSTPIRLIPPLCSVWACRHGKCAIFINTGHVADVTTVRKIFPNFTD